MSKRYSEGDDPGAFSAKLLGRTTSKHMSLRNRPSLADRQVYTHERSCPSTTLQSPATTRTLTSIPGTPPLRPSAAPGCRSDTRLTPRSQHWLTTRRETARSRPPTRSTSLVATVRRPETPHCDPESDERYQVRFGKTVVWIQHIQNVTFKRPIQRKPQK